MRLKITLRYTLPEIKSNPQVKTAWENIQDIKINPQLYTAREGIEEIKSNPQVRAWGGIEEIKYNPRRVRGVGLR